MNRLIFSALIFLPSPGFCQVFLPSSTQNSVQAAKILGIQGRIQEFNYSNGIYDEGFLSNMHFFQFEKSNFIQGEIGYQTSLFLGHLLGISMGCQYDGTPEFSRFSPSVRISLLGKQNLFEYRAFTSVYPAFNSHYQLKYELSPFPIQFILDCKFSSSSYTTIQAGVYYQLNKLEIELLTGNTTFCILTACFPTSIGVVAFGFQAFYRGFSSTQFTWRN